MLTRTKKRMNDEKLNSWYVQLVGIEGGVTIIKVADTEEGFLSTTVAELKQLIHKERPEIETDTMRLLFAGKQLNDEVDGEEATLETYNVQKRSTIHIVIRVHGGSDTQQQIPTRQSFTQRIPPPPVTMEDKMHDESDFTLKFTDDPDAITGISFPGDPKRVKMSCGHAVDPNTLTAWCRSLLDQQKVIFHCPAITDKDAKGVMKKQCKKVWDYVEVRRIALLNDAECSYFESKLSEYAALQYCDMKECPGCRSFVEREDLTNLRVTCPVCSKKKGRARGRTYDFCWQCLQDWTGPRMSGVKCGNSKCVHPELASVQDSPMFTLNGKEVPIRRACPTCGRVVEHMNDETCKFMVCPRCQKEYCFMCLELKSECLRTAPGGWFNECAKPVADKQPEIPVWSNNPRNC